MRSLEVGKLHDRHRGPRRPLGHGRVHGQVHLAVGAGTHRQEKDDEETIVDSRATLECCRSTIH